MRLYKRGDIYHGAYYDSRGKRVRVSTKCSDKRAAEAFIRQREREAHGAPRLPGDSPAYRVDQAVALLLAKGVASNASATVKMYRDRGGHLCRLLGQDDVNALDSALVGDYAEKRSKEGASRETVRKELVTLKRALETAGEHGHFRGEARAVLPRWRVRYVPRKRWLTPDELEQLLAKLGNDRHRLWVLLAVYTGGRASEVSSITWGDVDTKTRTIRVAGTKTDGSDRRAPIPDPLWPLLRNRGDADAPVAGQWLKACRDLARACEAASVPRVSPNDLRRTYASWLVQAGTSSYIVAQLLGHKTSRMVELVYGRLSPETLAQAVKALPGRKLVSHRRHKTGRRKAISDGKS